MPFMDRLDRRLAPETINEAIGLFHNRGLPIIRVHHTDESLGPAVDSREFQFHEAITAEPTGTIVIKHFPSAFKKTNLTRVLDDLGINTLFLCGLSATGCVLATYQAAYDLDYRLFVLKGGLLSPKASHTECVQDFCSTIDCAGIRLVLEVMG
jgi:nicotinamidase-related amidase